MLGRDRRSASSCRAPTAATCGRSGSATQRAADVDRSSRSCSAPAACCRRAQAAARCSRCRCRCRATRLVGVRAARARLAELLSCALAPRSVVSAAVAGGWRKVQPRRCARARAVCLFIAGTVLFSLAFLLSTVFADLWRPPLIVLCLATMLALGEAALRSPYGLFGTMSGELYFRRGELPWLGLLGERAALGDVPLGLGEEHRASGFLTRGRPASAKATAVRRSFSEGGEATLEAEGLEGSTTGELEARSDTPRPRVYARGRGTRLQHDGRTRGPKRHPEAESLRSRPRTRLRARPAN